MKVAEEDGGLGAGDDQNQENQKEKSKHVVDLARPANTHQNYSLLEPQRYE